MYVGLHVKYLLFLCCFNNISVYQLISLKILDMNFMVICLVGVSLLLEASIVGLHWGGEGAVAHRQINI